MLPVHAALHAAFIVAWFALFAGFLAWVLIFLPPRQGPGGDSVRLDSEPDKDLLAGLAPRRGERQARQPDPASRRGETVMPVPATDVQAAYVCVRTGGFMGWLIRKATKSDYNHAFIVTGDGGIIEARPEGVRRGTLGEYAGTLACANITERMTPAQGAAVAAKATDLTGTWYNYPDLVAIGLEDLGWHWRKLLHIAGADRLLICSQMVVVCGQAAALNWLCGETDAAQVVPGMLAARPGVQPITI